MTRLTRTAAALSLIFLAAGASAQTQLSSAAQSGIALAPLRFQARLQLTSLDAQRGSRLLSANLLGDYYLPGSLFGRNVSGGLRATGGLMLGSMSLLQSSSGLALNNSSLAMRQSIAYGQRTVDANRSAALNAWGADATMSYVGIGYTGQSLRGGWGFSADVGLAVPTGGLRLSLPQPSLDDTLRQVRLQPMLQLGVSYSF